MKLAIILNAQRINRIDARFLFLPAGHIESYRVGLAADRKRFRRRREGYQIQQRRGEGIGKIIEKRRHGEIMLVNSRDLCINYNNRALYIQVQAPVRQGPVRKMKRRCLHGKKA